MPSTIADVLRRLSRTRHENSACRNERGRQLRRPLARFSCLTITRRRGYGYAERAAVTLLVSRRGSRLTVFVNSKTMDEYIGRDLREKIENPVIFQPPGAAAASPVTSRANGYDASILIDICKAILDAKAGGKLSG